MHRRRLSRQLPAGVTEHFRCAARDRQVGDTRFDDGHNNQRWWHGSPFHSARATERSSARHHNQLHVCCFPNQNAKQRPKTHKSLPCSTSSHMLTKATPMLLVYKVSPNGLLRVDTQASMAHACVRDRGLYLIFCINSLKGSRDEVLDVQDMSRKPLHTIYQRWHLRKGNHLLEAKKDRTHCLLRRACLQAQLIL